MAEDKLQDQEDQYSDHISNLIPINELHPDIQTQLIREADRISLKKGKKLFKQGQRDNFSYYLLDGAIDLLANKQVHNTITSGTEQARYPMAQLQPRQFTGVAREPSVIMRLRRDALDRYLLLSQEKTGGDDISASTATDIEVSELDNDEELDWMSRLLQSEIFARMPTANIHQLFALLEPVEYEAGQVVVKQDDPGEDFYIIQEGRCQVLRRTSSAGKDIKLAELKTGDSFGEEALLAETTRNATVSMITDGVLMRLSKQDFIDLIMEPTLHAIDYEEADKQVEAGKARWVDVRYKNEHERSAIEGSMNVPLNMLRTQMPKLDRQSYYILYCDTGGRSSAAAFLMAGAGFDVSYLRGGLVNNPDAADPEEVTTSPQIKSGRSEQKRTGTGTPAEKETKERKNQGSALDDKDLDPEIKLSYLDTEITRNNLQLESTANREELNEAVKQAKAEAQKRLEKEKAKLEAIRKSTQEEARKLRQQEDEKLKQLKAQARKRIEEEKKKLEQVYAQNAEEMQKLERMKREAEEQVRKERERIEKASAEKINRGEAEKLKKKLENSRRAMEEELKKRIQKQQEMEKQIQMKARQKLEAERKKMAEEYARNNQELEQARRDKDAAEAARIAAKKEAEKVIAEYKAQFDKSRAEEESRLQQERDNLERERQQIQETLKKVQSARDEAEQLKQQATKEVTTLKEKQKHSDMLKDAAEKAALQSEIKKAEAKLQKAKLNVAQNQQKTVKIQQQKRMNTAGLESNQSEHQELRKQLDADLASFKEELKVEEQEYANARTQNEHMRRIRERAEAAKRKAQRATSSLMSDIDQQLGKKK